MKQQPALHPVDLLKEMTSIRVETPTVSLKASAHLVVEDYTVEMTLADNDKGFQLQLLSKERVQEFSTALKRLLNVWDITAPRWLWQMDAILDEASRNIALAERKNRRGEDR